MADSALVEWLKKGALFASATDAALSAAWGTDALETEIVSCLALSGATATEAARQQAFLGGPTAIERHNVPGLHQALIGRPVTITVARLGYDGGLTVFVIGAEELKDVERTELIVLRKLP
jgi:hypothetical protein